MGFINRIVSFLHSVLPFLFVVVVVVGLYGFFSAEEYEDDYVTFTVSCRSVRADREHYPSGLVEHCDRMASTEGR